MVRKADIQNAHVRSGKRQSPDVMAEDASRLLNDPAFIRAYDAVREGLIAEIENLKHDGQDVTFDYEQELCRTLRTLRSVRRAISMGAQHQKLRLADFRQQAPDED